MIYEKLKELGIQVTKNIPKGSSIILPDGYFLDLNENREKILTTKTRRAFLIHEDLEQFILRNKLVDINEYLTLNPKRATRLSGCHKQFLLVIDNAVYLQDGTNWKDMTENCYIELPEKLTKEQESTLLLWLDNLQYNVKLKSHRLEVIKGDLILTYYINDDFISEDIIKQIKKLYRG